MTIWSKTTSDGREVTAELLESGYWRVTLASELFAEKASVMPTYHPDNPDIRGMLGTANAPRGTKKIALTTAEYDEIKTIDDAAKEARLEARRQARAATPRGQYEAIASELFNARRDLRRLVDDDEHGEPAMEFKARDRITAAENALDAFAEAHPEVIAEVEAEERERQRIGRVHTDDIASENIARLMDQ